MPSICQNIKTEYDHLQDLKERFGLEFALAQKSGNLKAVKKLKYEWEAAYAALEKKTLVPLWYLRSLPEVKRKEQYHCLETLEGHTNWVYTLQVLPDGRIVSGGYDSTIKVWDKKEDGTYQNTQTLEGHTNWVRTLQVLPDGRIVSGSYDETIKVWDKKED